MNDVTYTTEPPTTFECDLDTTYYPHLLLIPAGIIITILSFLQRRSSFKKEVCGGRPGLVVPIDFLGMDHDRLAIMCVFGAATASIMLLIVKSISGYSNAWGKAFLIIGTCIEIAFLYYPYFGCLTSYHKIIGALMGLPYAVVCFILYLIGSFQKCTNYVTSEYVMIAFVEMPSILCNLFIMGKFILVLYKEIKEHGTFKVKFFFHNDDQSEVQVKLVRPWLNDYVKDLVKSKPLRRYSTIEFCLRKIYNPEKNFKFSTQTLSVVMICSILLYAISLMGVFYASLLLNTLSKAADNTVDSFLNKVLRGFAGSFIGAFILAAILCVISLIRFMENHKNNMLRMFKGDKSFIPRFMSVSQFMIGKGLRYHSFQIGYFMWGYLLLVLLFFVFLFGLYLLTFPYIRSWGASWVEGAGLEAGSVFYKYICRLGVNNMLSAVTYYQ